MQSYKMKKYTVLLVGLMMATVCMNAQTLKGDVNRDGAVDVSDVTSLVDIILSRTSTPEEAGDTLALIVTGLLERVAALELKADTVKVGLEQESVDRKAADEYLQMLIDVNKTHIKMLEEKMDQLLRKLESPAI